METKNTKDFTIAAANAVTDPGVLFGIGNSVMMYGLDNPVSGTANLATAALCLTIRSASELRNMGIDIHLPDQLDKLTKNPGLAYATSGIIGLAGTGIEAIGTDFSNPQTALPVAAMACFSSTGILRGMASGFDKGSIQQRAMDFGGVAAVVAGYALTSNNAPTTILCAYALALLMAGYLAARNRTAHGIVQPDLTFAGTNFANAFNVESAPAAIANAFWGMGATSVHALKTRGGVFVRTDNTALSPQSYGTTIHYTALQGTDFEMDSPYKSEISFS